VTPELASRRADASGGSDTALLRESGVVECRTCEFLKIRDAGNAPPRNNILRTDYWDVVHAFGTAIEGWTVLILRRHVAGISELTDDEALDLGPLAKRVSRALEDVLGCERTYVVLFAEDPAHAHVHIHVVPRFRDQPEEIRGYHVFTKLGLPDAESVPPERMDELALAIHACLTDERSQRGLSDTGPIIGC